MVNLKLEKLSKPQEKRAHDASSMPSDSDIPTALVCWEGSVGHTPLPATPLRERGTSATTVYSLREKSPSAVPPAWGECTQNPWERMLVSRFSLLESQPG